MRKLNKNNSSGVRGISFSRSRNKWQVKCCIGTKQYHRGYFDYLDDAKMALIDWVDDMVASELMKENEYEISTTTK